MIHLLFSILSSTAIVMIFKGLGRFDIDLFPVIILNYITASILGMFLYNQGFLGYYPVMLTREWFWLSMAIGVLLIVMFFMIGISTRKAGIAPTTVSMRMSVAIPVVFSIWQDQETVNLLKLSGILLAMAALVLTSVRKKDTSVQVRYIYLPLVLFMGIGILDSIVKYAQHTFISAPYSALFTGACFTGAFIAGLLACLLTRTSLSSFITPKVLFAGILLGICNFGSMFFLINALNTRVFDSSIIFGMNSIGIVSLSVFFAVAIYREKMLPVNWAGVVISVGAIMAMAWS